MPVMNQQLLLIIALIHCIPPRNGWTYEQMRATPSSVLLNMVGTWGFSTTSYMKIYRISKTDVTTKTVSVHCNTCPDILFKADGTGCIKSENAHTVLSVFKWAISGNKLVFVNTKNINKGKAALANGSYRIISHANITGFSAIELVDSKNTKQLLIKSD